MPRNRPLIAVTSSEMRDPPAHLAKAEADPRQRERVEELTHRVVVEPDSRLAEILGWDDGWVNSLHHQAVDALGEGLRVSARAPDGTVEAFESPEHPFLIAVQWHAEGLVGWPQHRPLFRAFVDACRVPAKATWALA